MRRALFTPAMLAALAALNVALGLFYSWYVVARLGTGARTDALFAGSVVPTLVLAVVSGSLTQVLVPRLATAPSAAVFGRDAWTCFVGVGAGFGALAALLIAGAPIWVPWTVPGFTASARALTVQLAQIQLLGMVFTALAAVQWSVQYARRRFAWTETSGALAAVLSLVYLYVALPRQGVMAAAWFPVLRSLLQTLFLLPGMGRFRRPDWRSETVRSAGRQLRPLLLGSAYYKLDPLVDRLLSSLAPPGGLSLLFLAQTIWGAGTHVAVKALVNPITPTLAVQAAAHDGAAFGRLYRRRFLLVAGVTTTIYLVLILAGRPALGLLIGAGGFTDGNVDALWRILVLAGGIWLVGPLGSVMTACFYATGDTVTPTLLGAAAFTLGVPLKLLLFHTHGLSGLAVGISLYYFVALALMWPALQRKLR